MKKNLLSVLLIVTVLVASLAIFAACNPDDNGGAEVKPYAIPEDLAVSVGIYDGNTLLGTVTKDTLSTLTQHKVTMTTINDYNTEKTVTYIAYKVTDAAAKLNITLPATITKVAAVATDAHEAEFEITSFANAYITVGTEENGAFAADNKGPRFLSDSTSTSSNSVEKFIAKIIVNPVAAEPEGPSALYNIVLTWSETNTALTAVITDLSSNKSNTIVISTAENANTLANVDDKSVETDPKKSDIDLGANKKISAVNKNTTYYGYELKTILAAMQFKNKTGTVYDVIEDYDFVVLKCSDDEATGDYTARAYTKAEIEGNVAINVVFDGSMSTDEGQTRVYSELADTFYDENDPESKTSRNKCKFVLSLVLYGTADAE